MTHGAKACFTLVLDSRTDGLYNVVCSSVFFAFGFSLYIKIELAPGALHYDFVPTYGS